MSDSACGRDGARPVCGSGTTLEAARLEGLSAVGIESNREICRIAAQRLGVEIESAIVDMVDRV